jgi:hypothetical protein
MHSPHPVEFTADLLPHASSLKHEMTIIDGGCRKGYALSPYAKKSETVMMQGIMDARHVLFFIHLESRRVSLAGITRYPEEGWMEQMARQLGKQSLACTTQVMPVH